MVVKYNSNSSTSMSLRQRVPSCSWKSPDVSVITLCHTVKGNRSLGGTDSTHQQQAKQENSKKHGANREAGFLFGFFLHIEDRSDAFLWNVSSLLPARITFISENRILHDHSCETLKLNSFCGGLWDKWKNVFVALGILEIILHYYDWQQQLLDNLQYHSSI